MKLRKSPLLLLIVITFFSLANCGLFKRPIKLGFISVLSGVHSTGGFRARNAVQFAIEQVNAEGGIDGRPIELIIKDDMMNTETAVKVANELLEENVTAIVAHTNSSNTVNIVPLLEESGTMMIGDAGTALLSGLDDNYLRICYASNKNGELFTSLIMDELNYNKAAVVYDVANPSYTEVFYRDFRTAMENRGGVIAGVITFDSEGEIVADQLADEIIATGAEACFIIGSDIHLALISQHLRRKGSTIKLITSTISQDLITAGGPAIEGALSILGFDNESTTERYNSFKKDYYERFSIEAGITDQQLYEATLIVIDALKNKRFGKSLKETILEKSVYPGLDGNIIIDDFGDASRTMYILEIRDGKVKTLDRIEPR